MPLAMSLVKETQIQRTLKFFVSSSVVLYVSFCCTEHTASIEMKCSYVVTLHQLSHVKDGVSKTLPILLVLEVFLTS